MLYQILSFLIGLVLVWIPVLVFCPRLKITDSMPKHILARNNPFVIKIRSDLDNWTGTLAQELYESKFKHNPINLLRLVFGDDNLEREMEIMGHEITVQFLPEDKQHVARLKHAKALRDSYKVFEDWTIDVIYECMLDETPYAQEWIADNINKITDLERKRYEQE